MTAGRPTLQTAADRKALIELMDQCMDKPSVFAKVFLKMDMFPTNANYVDCKERFIVYRSGRQHGKTTSTAVKTIHFAYFAPMMHERVIDVCDIVIVAPTQNQANNMLDRIKTLIHRSELLTKNIKKETTSEIHLSFANGKGTSRIYTRAAGEQGTSVRGYSPHIIIADECSFLPENVIVALMPAGMATKVHVWLTSTPYSPVGFFYNACMNSRPSNPNGQWIEFHAKSTDSPLIKEDPNFLEQITKQLTKEQYKMEVEGEFLEIGDSFIPRKLIEEAMEEPKEPMVITRYYMGCDIARQGKDETVFQIIGVDRNDVVHLVETYSEAQSNLVDLAGTIQKFIDKYNVQMAYLDSSGVGCLIKGTELLTDKGWKKIEDITQNDLVYSKNKEGYMSPSKILHLSKISNTRTIKSGDYGFSWSHVIPYKTRKEYPFKLGNWEHVLQRGLVYFDTEFKWKGVEPVLYLPSHIKQQPHGGSYPTKPDLLIDGEILCEFLGWFISEGNLDSQLNSYRITISQSEKSTKNKDIMRVLNKLGLNFNIRRSKSGEYSYSIHDKRLHDWLEVNCYNHKTIKRAFTKKIPDIIKNASPKYLSMFLNEFRKGDGWIHKGDNNYVTSSKQLANDLTEIIYKTGKYCGFRIKEKAGSTSVIDNGRILVRKHDTYIINEWRVNSKVFTPQPIIESMEDVYNIIVDSDTHYILTRFPNGMTFWTHNGGLIDICNARNMRIRAVIMSLEEQEILYKNLRMLFENKRIFLHGGSKTAYQLTYLKQKYTEGNKMRVTSEIPDDCADSLALACKSVESGNRIFILDAKGIFG